MDKKDKNQGKIALDNKTIAKLAISMMTAMKLKDEAIGPLTRKVLEQLDTLDTQVPHFVDYEPKD